jgi:hypothetical protein
VSDVCGVTLVTKFPYRGNPLEEYSNGYHFTGDVPATEVAWKALADALIAQQKTVLWGVGSIIRAYGYATDDPLDHAVWSHDYLAAGASVVGTYSIGSGAEAPGDCAVWVRWKTSRLSVKGKPIYLRKYFHPAVIAGSGGAAVDQVEAGQIAALNALGAKLSDGSFIDARTIRSQPHDDTILSHSASPYVTTRTLKRRGKRP